MRSRDIPFGDGRNQGRLLVVAAPADDATALALRLRMLGYQTSASDAE